MLSHLLSHTEEGPRIPLPPTLPPTHPTLPSPRRNTIVGVILAKELVLINPADNSRIKELRIRPLPHLSADTPM
jgi:hypothetical protein